MVPVKVEAFDISIRGAINNQLDRRLCPARKRDSRSTRRRCPWSGHILLPGETRQRYKPFSSRDRFHVTYFDREKSTLFVPGTLRGLVCCFIPSCHATRLYLPSGTFSSL